VSSPVDKSPPLQRYVRILEVLASFPEGTTALEIGSMLGLPKPTVHRLLKVMQDSEIVDGHAPNRYVLGERIRRLIFLGSDMKWMDTLVRPKLCELAEATGETCFVGKLETGRVVSVMMESPNTPWRGFVWQGQEFPAHAAAGAKAILAHQPLEIVDQILPASPPALTRFTKTSRTEILAEYEVIRRKGFATCIGEIVEEIVAIAVPVRVEGAPVIYSLGTTGPRSHLTSHGYPEIVERLVSVAKSIAATLKKVLAMQARLPLTDGPAGLPNQLLEGTRERVERRSSRKGERIARPAEAMAPAAGRVDPRDGRKANRKRGVAAKRRSQRSARTTLYS
jgi:DNA-binding IclR family transcriptional regulator